MQQAKTICISIDRNWQQLYDAVWKPETFPKWASGLSNSSLVRDGEMWRADGPSGTARIRFTEHNRFGVMDHWVHLSDGQIIYVPLRIVENGSGAEVLLTLFRQPGMSDDHFAADADWVRRDLLALESIVGA
jgi:hypothetical protein